MEYVITLMQILNTNDLTGLNPDYLPLESFISHDLYHATQSCYEAMQEQIKKSGHYWYSCVGGISK